MSFEQSDHRAAHAEHDRSDHTSFWRSKAWIVTCGFLLIGAFFLLTEHWAHVLGVLPYLLILACPLIHLVMYKGHGSHGGHQSHDRTKRTPDSGADA